LRVVSVPEPQRVSSLELFFDLVFVFTITQLTEVLAEGHDLAALGKVAVMLAVIWWMYDGYAWLTNSIPTDRPRFMVLLLGGMGAFLILALAIPREDEGLAFGLAYLVVVLLHTGMFVGGATRVILRIAPANVGGALLLVIGGALGGEAQWVLWTIAAVGMWVTPWIVGLEGFVVGAAHFVERHGLVIIIALGESIVVIGAGATTSHVDLDLVVVALLSLALSASLWWLYFRDEEPVERAMVEAPTSRRARLALVAFGYWHYGLILGVVGVSAGLKKSVGHPYDPLDGWIGSELAVGVALFVACTAGFTATLGLGIRRVRLAAAALVLLTIPVGTQWTAAGEIALLTAIVAAALALEGKRAVDLVQHAR